MQVNDRKRGILHLEKDLVGVGGKDMVEELNIKYYKMML